MKNNAAFLNLLCSQVVIYGLQMVFSKVSCKGVGRKIFRGNQRKKRAKISTIKPLPGREANGKKSEK